MRLNRSALNGSSSPPQDELPLDRPPWVTSTLAAILIFTIVVDILGNLLVILSVYRNKKLRNAVAVCQLGRKCNCAQNGAMFIYWHFCLEKLGHWLDVPPESSE